MKKIAALFFRNKRTTSFQVGSPKETSFLPSDLLIQIASYLTLKDLLHFALADRFLLIIFFNSKNKNLQLLSQERQDESKQLLKGRSFSSKPVPSSDKFQKEYKKDEDQDFEVIQLLIWKPLVCYYFPKFESSNIRNWMHVLRRRIEHIKLYNPIYLPLQPKDDRMDFKVFNDTEPLFRSDPNYDDEFIENCEWIYKCPLLTSSRFSYQEFCSVCEKTVFKVTTMSELKSHVKEGHCVAFTLYDETDIGGLM